MGEELLAPHRCYAPAILPLLDEFGTRIHALAHITGGGFYDNIPRALPADCQALVDRRTWQPAPIFTLIQQAGNVADTEMYRTFNMGIGMVLVVAREDSLQIVESLRAGGESAAIIGEVIKGSNEVQVI